MTEPNRQSGEKEERIIEIEIEGDGSSFTLHMDANEIKWYNL